VAGALALALLASGCSGWSRWPWWSVQRHPEPAVDAVDPLPPGAHLEFPEGPEEVLVVRLADPVRLRPAGRRNGFPLSFHDKTARARSGSSVTVAPGGRAEVLWPSGTTLRLSGRGFALIGSPSRGESLMRILDVERAQITLKEPEQVELPGGSRLFASSGPFSLERLRADLVRLRNQSKAAGQLAIRDELFHLDPGQSVDLPLLSAGGAPLEPLLTRETVQGPGFALAIRGAAEAQPAGDALRVRALGDHELRALGQSLRLDAGGEALIGGLGAP
jgi:hypothetical protein